MKAFFLYYLSIIFANLKLWGRAAKMMEGYLQVEKSLSASDYYHAGFFFRKSHQKVRALQLLEKAVEMAPEKEKYRLMYFKVMAYSGKRELALQLSRNFLAEEPLSVNRAYTLAYILRSQERWAQLVELLAPLYQAGRLDREKRFWLADAYERIGLFEQASILFDEYALAITPSLLDQLLYRFFSFSFRLMQRLGVPTLHKYGARGLRWLTRKSLVVRYPKGCFRAANIYRLIGNEERSCFFFSQARKRNVDELVKRLGLGIVFQRQGEWRVAREFYQKELLKNSDAAELHYRIGLTFEYEFEWAAAASAYQDAIFLNPTHDAFMRLGVVYERLGADIEKAATAYKGAIRLAGGNNENVYYSLGRLYRESGNPKVACDWFARMMRLPQCNLDIGQGEPKALAEKLKEDVRSWQDWEKLGSYQYSIGKFSEAATSFYQALMRSSAHKKRLYFYHGICLRHSGNHVAAADSFLNCRVDFSPTSVMALPLKKGRSGKSYTVYNNYYENLSLQEDAILYETFGGAGISCNPYAIFMEILRDSRFFGLKHFWVLDDLDKVPGWLKNRTDVYYVKKGTDLYFRCLASCKYLINNTNFPPYFIRKEEQRYLNTWHGTPLKTLGFDLKDTSYPKPNTVRNFIQASHLISPNSHTTSVFSERHGISGVITAKVLESGYPRVDMMLNASLKRKREIFESLSLSQEKPVVLFAPTWRGVWDDPTVESDRLVEDLLALVSEDYQLVFRGHHVVESRLAELDLPVTVASQVIDSCELLSIVDVLVSDYSSIFYDFLPSGRPIIHYVYDFDEYQEARGMYFGREGMPGEIAEDLDSLRVHLGRVMQGDWAPSAKYLSIQQQMSGNEDGLVTKRVLDFFFDDIVPVDRVVRLPDTRPTLLLYGAEFEGGEIAPAFESLVNGVDRDSFSICVVINSETLDEFPERYGRLLALRVDIVVRSGRLCNSAEEEWVVNEFLRRSGDIPDGLRHRHSYSYLRDFRRVLSYKEFHSFLGADGSAKPDYINEYYMQAAKHKGETFFSGIHVGQIKSKSRSNRKPAFKGDKEIRVRHAVLGVLPFKAALHAFGVLICKAGIQEGAGGKKHYHWGVGSQKHKLRKITLLKVLKGGWEYSLVLYIVRVSGERHLMAGIHTPVMLCMGDGTGEEIKRRLPYNNIFSFLKGFPFVSHVSSIKRNNLAFYLRSSPKGNLYLTVRNFNLSDAFMQRLKINFAYFISRAFKYFLKGSPVLIYEKKSEKYEESASILYERLVDLGYKNFKYVISDEGIKRYGIKEDYRAGLVRKGSLRHYLLFFLCETFVSTEAPAHAIDLRIANMFALKKLNEKKFAYVFLQHGPTYMVSLTSMSRKAFRKIDGAYPANTKVVVSSKLEASHFIECGGYAPEDIYITGLPKFDKASRNFGANKIVVMPTWRPWEYNSLGSSVEDSGYYRMIEEIVAGIPEEQESNIIVLPHPLFKDMMAGSKLARYIPSVNYEEVLQNAALLITDYSSISYDAFNRGAAVIFWWKDKSECMERYGGYLLLEEDTAFGPVVYGQADLSVVIREALNNELDQELFMARFRDIVNDFGRNSSDALIAQLVADGFIK